MTKLTSRQVQKELQGITFREKKWDAINVKTANPFRTRILDRKRHNIFLGQFKAQCSLEQISFFAIVKEHHDDSGPEFLTMKRFWNHLYRHKASPFSMPEPLYWLAGNKLLVLEYIKGHRLSFSILRDQLPFFGLRRRKRIQDQLYLVADWLLDFQKNNLRQDKFDLPSYFCRVKRLVESMEGCWKQLAENIITDLQPSLNNCCDLPSVMWHGDFLHRNVLLTKNRIILVDWEGEWVHQSLHPLYEAFQFSSNLECLARPMKKVIRLFQPERVQQLSDFFLERYLLNRFFPLCNNTLTVVYWLFLVQFLYKYLTQGIGLNFRRTKETDTFMKQWFLTKKERTFPLL